MRISSVSICAAAIALAGVTAGAQSPVERFEGCVQKESSVLKRNPVAANVGMDDEFVITFAKAAVPGGDIPKSEVPPEPKATSGSPGNFGTVYRLTGDKEKELKSLVGQRVEVSGSIKDKEKMTDALSSVGTSGKVELTPANTAEISIDSIRPLTGGSCAPLIK